MKLSLDDSPFRTATAAIDVRGNYQPVSYWQETIRVTPGVPLAADVDCDVAIIGGGFTGLSTAYELKRSAPDLEVVVLERGICGHGASGRNGGFAMPLIGWDLTDAAAKLGEKGAGDAYRLTYAAVDHTRRLAEENGIDCELEATGYLLLATCDKRLARLRHELELSHRLGFNFEWLEGAALESHIRSKSFIAGVHDPHTLILNPAKLARGMKETVERLGVSVFEQTSLEELHDEQPLVLRTKGGRIRAKAAVLAVNGYGAALGFMPERIVPVHTYISLSEPLTNAQLDDIGWRAKRTSLETARNFIHYFRLTADNRVLFGGEDAKLYWHGAYYDYDPPTFERLEARFREYFPSLARVRFTHRWGGVLGVTLDMFPTFGRGGANQTVFHAAGYSGHGVSLSNFAGRILAPRILETLGRGVTEGPDSLPFFYNRKPTWLPPDPLRYIGLQAYRQALRLHDWWLGA